MADQVSLTVSDVDLDESQRYADHGCDTKREPKNRLLDGDEDDSSSSAVPSAAAGGPGTPGEVLHNGGASDGEDDGGDLAPTQDYGPVLQALQGRRGMGSMAGAVPAPCCYSRRVGNFYIYSERETNDGSFDVRCMVGPCWPMLAFTYTLIIGISTFVYSFTFPKAHPVLCLLAVCSLLGLIIALQRTACTNPGMLPRYSKVGV
jgi:hypothetical protein